MSGFYKQVAVLVMVSARRSYAASVVIYHSLDGPTNTTNSPSWDIGAGHLSMYHHVTPCFRCYFVSSPCSSPSLQPRH
ncbi:hypothetical protein KCP74_03355 [Salmonella enterica subsp. enterica]|nr:hypothetical protein KCP74_03355 [Salmonella enterica subsp. enterica]